MVFYNLIVYVFFIKNEVDTAVFQGIKKLITSKDEQKDLIDPYVAFSFAGQEVCEIVKLFAKKHEYAHYI